MAEETTSEEKKEVEVPEKFKSLVESIEKLSVIDLSELVHVLEDKFGVSAAAPVAVAAAPAAGGAAEEAEAKSAFNVVLAGVGDKKIEVIKVVRDATGKGLKEAKDLVDAAASGPQVVKENAAKEEADDLKKKLDDLAADIDKQHPDPTDEDLVEKERVKHINKRYNVKDRWLPLK